MSHSFSGNRLSATTLTQLRSLRHCVHFPLWCTRWGLKLLVLVYFILAITFLLLRHVGAPQIAAHRAEIVEALGQQLGLTVEIAQLDAHWDGLRPTVAMRGMRLIDAQQREVLLLPRVDAQLGWSTLWRRELTLHSLTIAGADLAIQRDAAGKFLIAGIPVTANATGQPGFAEFLLGQHRIEIHDSRLRWEDAQRGAPPLHLDKLALRLDNNGDRHRFALRAQPMSQLTAPLDIRGDLRGSNPRLLADWRGTLYLDLQGADLAIWQQWLDYPIELPKGRGALRAWLNFEGARIGALTADVALANLQVRVQPDLPMLDLAALQGRLRLSARDGERYLAAERITLTGTDGQKTGPSHFALRSAAAQPAQGTTAATPGRGEFSARALDMRMLAQVASHLPLPEQWQTRLAEAQPRGILERVEARWEAGPDAAAQPFARYQLNAKASGLAMNAVRHVPGVEGLNVELDGTEKGGQFRIDVSKGALELPAVFRESRVELGTLRSKGEWAMEGSATEPQLRIVLKDGILKNADADAEFAGNWVGVPGTAGRIDLVANASRALPVAVWRYIPARLPQSLPDWLQHGLQGGVARDVTLRLRGPLNHFPFLDGDGEFHVSGRFSGARLDYAPGSWPALDDVQGELLFEGKRMLITGRSARYRDVILREVSAEIPDLMEVGKQHLTVRGRAKGSTREFLGVVSASSLPQNIRRFAQDVRAEGIGELSLKLDMPLHAIRETQVQGEYQFDANTLRLLPRLPDFSNASARLQFTEHGITLPSASADFLGSPLTATGTTDADGILRFAIRGKVDPSRLKPLLDTPLWSHFSGEAPATASLSITRNDAELRVESTLQGIASNLPAPFGKTSASTQAALFAWRQLAPTTGGTSEQHWQLRIGNLLDAQWQQQCRNDACEFARGAVGINEAPAVPANGMRVTARFNQLNLDTWRPILLGWSRDANAGGGGTSLLSGATLQVQSLLLGGHVFRDQQARVLQDKERWLLRLDGQDAAGELSWDAEGQGLLRARLTRLALNPPEKKETTAARSEATATPGTHEQLPALDIKADTFLIRDRALGALDLQAHNQAEAWLLDRINIWSEDGDIAATGQYRALRGGAASETQLNFKLSASNLGKMMARFGYADAIAGGQASLGGKLSWNAAPTTLDYASLNGNMDVSAKSGQFIKLDPGAGRLLGVLSLQAIPRRVTLDFRDVFSEGFAFDNISGKVDVVQGVMRTQDFTIRGPAAKVIMRGSTDIGREQHNLAVNVQPTLSESVALGAAAVGVVNPAIGLATYLAQKLLSDPVERLFAYDYSISGSWADPVVAKVGSPLTQSGPRKENTP